MTITSCVDIFHIVTLCESFGTSKHLLHLEFKRFGWSSCCFFTAGNGDVEPELSCCKADDVPHVPFVKYLKLRTWIGVAI